MNNLEMATTIRYVSEATWDEQNKKMLEEVATALEALHITVIWHDEEEYPNVEVLKSINMPVRKVHIKYLSGTVNDTGFVTPRGVGTDLEEQNSIVQDYLNVIAEAESEPYVWFSDVDDVDDVDSEESEE